MKRFLVVLSLCLLASVANAADVDLTFEWDANTETYLAGYRIYFSEQKGGPYVLAKSVGKVTTTDYAIDIFPGETFYFVLTAYGDNTCPPPCESGYSNEVFFSLPPDHPANWPMERPTFRLKSWAAASSTP